MKKATRLLPILVFIACLAISVGYYWAYGQHNLDSDISSEFVLAQLLNEEGRLLTDNWFYSTELRLVSPVPIYQLALLLFDSWHLARTVSIAILLCAVSASLMYMARGLGVSFTSALLCASAFVLPVTVYQSFTLVYGGFYTICVALTFVEIGLVLRMEKGRLREPVLLVVLGFIGGLNGIRLIMICVAPLLAACAINFFLEVRRCERWKQALALPSARLLAGGLLCAAATFGGNAVNANVLADIYTFEQFDETMLASLRPEMFTDQLMCLMAFFGYREDVLLLSREGVVSVLAVLLPFMAGMAMMLLLRMNLSSCERLLALFMPVALLLGMLVNVLTMTDESDMFFPYHVSYYMPAALLMVFSIFWALDRFECKLRALRVLPMLALVGAFLAGNAVYREIDMNTDETELENIAQYLLEEDCTQGYATYWNANVLTEITDGQIEVFTVDNWTNGEIDEWLQRKDHLDRTPDGRVFAIFSAQNWEEGVPGCDEERLFYASDRLYVCIYENNSVFEELRWE
ncbi:MAG: hypothetical protein Q4G52_10355 [Clostridia bacterium]|nr:hypothetical protein [Clostridia bacterium]